MNPVSTGQVQAKCDIRFIGKMSLGELSEKLALDSVTRREEKRRRAQDKNTVSLRTTKSQTISNKVSYSLSRDINVPATEKGSWGLRHGEKAQRKTPADCLNFPSQFLPMFASSQFDDVTSSFVLLPESLTLRNRCSSGTLYQKVQLRASVGLP